MRTFKVLCIAILAAALTPAGGQAGEAGESTSRIIPLVEPSPDMSADELMQIDYVIKYTKFLEDTFINDCVVSYIHRSGRVRTRRAQRMRITLNRPEDGLDYKDLVVITHPENVKGLAIMTWSYLDPDRLRDQWLYLPSLKRVRRTSPADARDAFMGSDFTIEDVTSRRWEDETYKRLPDAPSPGYRLRPDGEVVNKDIPCYVIECRPKHDPWYYSKRIVYLDKTTGGNIYEEIYDEDGNLARTITRVYEMLPEGPIQQILEAHDLNTEHSTRIVNNGYEANTGLDESIFTERNLLRSRW